MFTVTCKKGCWDLGKENLWNLEKILKQQQNQSELKEVDVQICQYVTYAKTYFNRWNCTPKFNNSHEGILKFLQQNFTTPPLPLKKKEKKAANSFLQAESKCVTKWRAYILKNTKNPLKTIQKTASKQNDKQGKTVNPCPLKILDHLS